MFTFSPGPAQAASNRLDAESTECAFETAAARAMEEPVVKKEHHHVFCRNPFSHILR